MISENIQSLFFRFLGIEYHTKTINDVSGESDRTDFLYEELTKKFFYKSKKEKRTLLILAHILEKQDGDTQSLTTASYIHALNYDRPTSIKLMEKVICLEKGVNLDSWLDLGLFLRKIPSHQKLSTLFLLSPVKTAKKYDGESDIISFLEKNLS